MAGTLRRRTGRVALVARFLSAEWLAAMDRAVGDRPDLADPGDPDESGLVIGQIVTGTPTGEVRYTIRLQHGKNAVHLGIEADADVVLSTDYATAVAVIKGDESAQAAFVAGRIRVAGDATALLRHRAVVAELDDAFAPVRALTEF